MARLDENDAYSIITDHIGTPVEAYNSIGKKVWERELEAYGKIKREIGEINLIPFQLPGQYFDIETGLCNQRYRYFSPDIGAFISQDPIGLAGGNPTMYGFVFDSNTQVDVFGLECGKNAKILRENMAKEGRIVGKEQAAGHIVASTGSKNHFAAAVDSRKLLDKYKIGINDAANGISIGHPTPHNIMHTGNFHTNVRNRLLNLESKMIDKGFGHNAIRGALRRELRKIGNETLNSL